MNPPSAPPPTVIPEVLPPDAPVPAMLGSGPPPPQTPRRRMLFEPLAALALIVVDNLWNIPEFIVVDWPVTVPLCFLSVFAATLAIQRKRAGDRWGTALWKALLLAIVAAVPTSLTGTPVGLALLAWAGIRHPWHPK